MINFALGVAVGAAFAPFWMMLYNTYMKPTVSGWFKKK
jgi:hypothetical protein